MLAVRRTVLAALALGLPSLLAGCNWQPLHGASNYTDAATGGAALSQVTVSDVDSRVGQQLRNHLLFLLHGGRDPVESRYEARIRVSSSNTEYAAVRNIRDFTAGAVTVTVSYDLIDKTTLSRVAGGSRIASAPYDRTAQNFANSRAVRDAENRAAREAAEQLRMALAADLQG
jgi:LPS-assembly lipoprotein